MDELMAEFVAETRDTLGCIAEALVGWEAHPQDAARIDEIFRFVHTVKGSCGFLDLPRIAFLADAAETALAEVRAGERAVDAPLIGTMLGIIDRIALLAEALEDGRALPPEDTDSGLVARLNTPMAAPVVQAEVAISPARSVRVAVPLLETMMDQVSELVLVRNELARSGAGDLAGFARLTTLVGGLRDSVTRTRMQPIERLFAALPRLVRDTAHEVGKSVDLAISGEDVEIDREMVEAIRDPLIHIVRNAIDHGIEDAATRQAMGKPATGRLTIAASQSGNQVSIEIGDDGGGIDTGRLIAQVVAAGRDGAARMSSDEAVGLVFHAGLSTAAQVTHISGRGVGMDVVRANIERLGGTVTLVNRPGQGLTVRLCAPLTLSIVTALLVEAGQRFAIPRSAIVEVLPVGSGARIEALGAGQIAVVRSETLTFKSLAEAMDRQAGVPKLAVVVATAGGLKFALGIDGFGEQEELVVRPMAPALNGSGVFAGQSLADDGRPIAVLDIAGIARRCGIVQSAYEPSVTPAIVADAPQVLRAAALDGSIVAVRAALVERVVMTACADWIRVGERWHASIAGETLTGIMIGPPPDEGGFATLLVGDGVRRVALAVAEVGELVPIGATTPIDHPLGEALARIDGAWVMLLDGFALLAHATPAVARATAPFDVGATPWARNLLAPMLGAAGYEVRAESLRDSTADRAQAA